MPEEPPSVPPPMDDDDGNNDKNIVENASDAASDAVDQIKDAINAPPPSTEGAVLGAGKLSETDEKTMGMLAHLLGAFTFFVGPLIIWLIKKEESPFLNSQGKEALNFQILIAISYVAVTVVSFVLPCLAILYPVVVILNLVFCILGCLEANKGIAYRYPFNLRLIS